MFCVARYDLGCSTASSSSGGQGSSMSSGTRSVRSNVSEERIEPPYEERLPQSSSNSLEYYPSSRVTANLASLSTGTNNASATGNAAASLTAAQQQQPPPHDNEHSNSPSVNQQHHLPGIYQRVCLMLFLETQIIIHKHIYEMRDQPFVVALFLSALRNENKFVVNGSTRSRSF